LTYRVFYYIMVIHLAQNTIYCVLREIFGKRYNL
jgi:hypothetical protein